MALVGGIALGALGSSLLSGTRRRGVSPAWGRALGTDSRLARFVLAFVAGFVMLAGARIADGCTSGPDPATGRAVLPRKIDRAHCPAVCFD